MGVKYGGNNDVNVNKCAACKKSCDTHKPFAWIESDALTEKMAKDLQQALDAARTKGALKGYDEKTTSAMVGTAIATINNGVYKFATLSGPSVAWLPHIKNNLGKDVKFIDALNAGALTSITGKKVAITPVAKNRNRDYPVGSCAAQKLLMAVFKEADAHGGRSKITKLAMAEILWSDPFKGGHNRDWSTGQVVISCDTCKQVVPALLCSDAE